MGVRGGTALEVARRAGPVGSRLVGMLERVGDGVAHYIYAGGGGAAES